ncbi:MAG TPA: GNAT family protein [Anaerolineae bacterium]|nr:GNAT family protein [Anaerolineae bacterium]
MLNGERVILRAIERSDLPNYVRWLNDPAVLHYFGRFKPLSLMQEEQWYEKMLEDSTALNVAVELEGRHVGGAGLVLIDGRVGSAEVGLFIGLPELWDQGLGLDVLRTLLRFGFEQLNLHRISLRVFAENERAIHLYEKVGFRHEGRWREADFRHGRFHDILWMSILSREWAGQGADA